MERFEEKGGFVTDHKTGLEWQSKVSGPMTWYKAMKLPESFGDGWRLPTIEELGTLVDRCRENPASSFLGMISDCFWSSSSCVGFSSSAWFVNFYYGNVDYDGKKYSRYVRCVRSSGKEMEK